jgi:hypothetical protein
MVAFLWLALHYASAVAHDYLWYCYVYLLLSLPPRFFRSSSVPIGHTPDATSKHIWFTSIYLILDLGEGRLGKETISSSQLLLLADDEGRIAFNTLQLYYPNLDVLYMRYLDMATLESNLCDDSSAGIHSGESSRIEVVTKIIDVKKRVDIQSGDKCRFGRIQI